MKVLMVLSKPFMVDPRVYKEAKSLVDAGHEVTVVVWDRRGEYEPRSVVDGVNVIRVHNRGLMKIVPHDLLRNPLWWRRAYKKGLDLYSNGFRFEVVHCHDLDTLQVGVWLKRKLGVKLVYDVHEIFGYMVRRTMPRFVGNFSFRMEKRLVTDVDFIITVADSVKQYLESITQHPIELVMNCKDLIGTKYQPPKNDRFTVVYIGVLHKGRMFPQLVDIMGRLPEVSFVIAGKKENLYEDVKRSCVRYENIKFLGTIPFQEVIPATLAADAVIHMVNPTDMNNRIGLANKQFEAMVCGRPIIVTKNVFAGELAMSLECGLGVDYTEESIRNAIFQLRNSPELCERLGRNGLKAAIQEYNWENQKNKLLKVYRNLGA